MCQKNCIKQPEGTGESDPITFWMDSPKWERIVRNLALAVRLSLILTLLEKEVWITLLTIVSNIKPLIQKSKIKHNSYTSHTFLSTLFKQKCIFKRKRLHFSILGCRVNKAVKFFVDYTSTETSPEKDICILICMKLICILKAPGT